MAQRDLVRGRAGERPGHEEAVQVRDDDRQRPRSRGLLGTTVELHERAQAKARRKLERTHVDDGTAVVVAVDLARTPGEVRGRVAAQGRVRIALIDDLR